MNVILVLICILFFDNCRQRDECEGSPKSNYNYDSTHFDSSELIKIPDWQGDSLYFYSDVGDTAYMFCAWQSPPNSFAILTGGSNALPCPYVLNFCHPSQRYTYQSNEPSLNGLQIHIYKESNGSKQFPTGPPLSRMVIGSYDYGAIWLSDYGDTIPPADSVIISNGFIEHGWQTSDGTIFNIKVGILILNKPNSKKWTLFKYKLNN